MAGTSKQLIFVTMQPFSIVIICRNESHIIARSLKSLEGLTDDVIVYDNGSTDGTQDLVRQVPVRLEEGAWEGFGKTKNRATALAKYDWILSLDADEAVDDELRESLRSWNPVSEREAFRIRFKNYLGERFLSWGEWGHDWHVRLFNRRLTRWDEAQVHEGLIIPGDVKVKKLKGCIEHRTMRDMQDYAQKMLNYAVLGAEKYAQRGKKATWLRLLLSPAFTFFRYYIMKLGFLDGYAGYVSAKMTAWYTFLKYSRLRELNKR